MVFQIAEELVRGLMGVTLIQSLFSFVESMGVGFQTAEELELGLMRASFD